MRCSRIFAVILVASVALAANIEVGSSSALLDTCALVDFPEPCQLATNPYNRLSPVTSCLTAVVGGQDVVVFNHQRGISFHATNANGIASASSHVETKHCYGTIPLGQVGDWFYYAPDAGATLTPECACTESNLTNCKPLGLNYTYPDGHWEIFSVFGIVGMQSLYSLESVQTLQVKLADPILGCTNLTQNANLTGTLGMVRKGNCLFSKPNTLQAAGASAVLYWNVPSSGADLVAAMNATVLGISINGPEGQKIFDSLNGTGAVGYATFGPGIYSSSNGVPSDPKTGLTRINITAAMSGIRQVENLLTPATGIITASFIETELGGSRPYLWLVGLNGLERVNVYDLSGASPALLSEFSSFSAVTFGPFNETLCNLNFKVPAALTSGIVSDLVWGYQSTAVGMSNERPSIETWASSRHFLFQRNQAPSYGHCTSQSVLHIWNVTDVAAPVKIFSQLYVTSHQALAVTKRNFIAAVFTRGGAANQRIEVYPRQEAEPGLPNGEMYTFNITDWDIATNGIAYWARVDRNGIIWIGIGAVGLAALVEDPNTGVVSQYAWLPQSPLLKPVTPSGWSLPSCAAKSASSPYLLYGGYAGSGSGVGGIFTQIDYQAVRLDVVPNAATTVTTASATTGTTTSTGGASGTSTVTTTVGAATTNAVAASTSTTASLSSTTGTSTTSSTTQSQSTSSAAVSTFIASSVVLLAAFAVFVFA